MSFPKAMINTFVGLFLLAFGANALIAADPPLCYQNKVVSCEKALHLVMEEYEWRITCGGCKENHTNPDDPDSPLDPFAPYVCETNSSEDLYIPSNSTISFYEKVTVGGYQTISEDDMPIECGIIAHCMSNCIQLPGGRICDIDDFGVPPFMIDTRHVTGIACTDGNSDLPGGE